MRQRVTFLHRPGDAVDPSTLRITDNSLTGPQEIRAAREVRTTLALDELPAELASVLQTSHELHVRWVAPDAFDTVTPLHSRLSPGFHLFFTPRQGGDASESLVLPCRLDVPASVANTHNQPPGKPYVSSSARHLGGWKTANPQK